MFTGSFDQTGSVFLRGLTQVSKSFVVGYDNTTGQLTYQTAVDNADTASFAVSASYASASSYSANAGTASFAVSASYASASSYSDSSISASFATTASTALSGNGIFTGSFTGSFTGDGSQLTGVVATSAFNLTQGTGVTAFTYNGISAQTVAVSGAAALTSGSVTKWSGNAFVNSSISDLGNVTINNPGGVTIQAGGLYVTGSSTFHDNVVIQGNLTVNGTASFQNVENLAVKDQFILLNSGSSTFQDSGIVINTGNLQNSGSAFFLETSGTTTGTDGLYGRFAVAVNVLPDATSATAAEYANTTAIVAGTPGSAVPQFGGTGLGQGNMWVNTNNGDIYIYA